jgi:hypothetical protein
MRKTTFLKAAWLLVLPVLGLAGCSNTSTTSTSPTTPTTPVIQTVSIHVYAGPLDPGGAASYIITLDSDATVQVTLVGEQLNDPIRTLSVPLQIDISNWDGSLCTPMDSVVVTPRLTAHLQRYLTAGSYCVHLSDPGTLTQTIGSVVRVSFPAPKVLPGTASPVTFSSTILPGGVSSKTFVASQEGDVSITLKSVATNRPVGLGIGVYGTDVTTTCTLTRIVNVPPGTVPQITEHVDAGPYCAAVVDTGTISAPTAFSMDITNP